MTNEEAQKIAAAAVALQKATADLKASEGVEFMKARDDRRRRDQAQADLDAAIGDAGN